MKKEELFDIIGDIDGDLIEEAGRVPRRAFPIKKIIAAAACFVMIAAAAIVTLPRTLMRDAEEKSQVDNYYATYGKAELITAVDSDDLKNTETYHESMSDMMAYAEKELFSHPTDIFRGEIMGESYYLVDFEGVGYYYSVVTVRVDKVYRGDLASGDVISIKAGAVSRQGIWVEDTETVSAMKEGISGIFMVNDYMGEIRNDAFFDGGGVITHHFRDGERYAFLETEAGLVFSEWAYPSLENAKTLQDVEAFVKKMVK